MRCGDSRASAIYRAPRQECHYLYGVNAPSHVFSTPARLLPYVSSVSVRGTPGLVTESNIIVIIHVRLGSSHVLPDLEVSASSDN